MDGPEGRGPQDAPGRVPERLRAAAGEGAGFGREAEVGAVLAALRGARPALPTAAVLRLVPELRERVGAPAAAAAEEADQRYRLFGAVRAILARWSEESRCSTSRAGRPPSRPAPAAPRLGARPGGARGLPRAARRARRGDRGSRALSRRRAAGACPRRAGVHRP